MDFRTVARSKSFNITNKSIVQKSKNKKSLSNAHFQPFAMKKRGVYVEKKVENCTDTQVGNGKSAKAPQRRGQKKFLASVLTILSKSTFGTQYPEIKEVDDKTREQNKFKPRHRSTHDGECKTAQKINKTRRTKLRPRVLNEEMLRADREQSIILQSREDIAQTPSNYTARSKNFTDSVRSDVLNESEPKRSKIRDILENNIYSGVAETITKEVLEGSARKERKIRINDDSVTLASGTAKKHEEKLYNFFVDLLETTINVYNDQTSERHERDTVLDINDCVAKKLELKFESTSQNYINIPKCRRIDNTEGEIFKTNENIPIDIKLSEHKPLATTKPKLKAKPFVYPVRKLPPISNSFDRNRRNKRRPKKNALLTILTEQLKKDSSTFQEPESLYDALEVMARKKRRCEKPIRFVKNPRAYTNEYDHECMFHRQKIQSFKLPKKNKPAKNAIPTYQSGNYTNKYDPEVEYKYFPSYHSLEVHGYDYEEPVSQPEVKRDMCVTFAYHSTPSSSGSNLADYNTRINCPGSSLSSNCSFFNR